MDLDQMDLDRMDLDQTDLDRMDLKPKMVVDQISKVLALPQIHRTGLLDRPEQEVKFLQVVQNLKQVLGQAIKTLDLQVNYLDPLLPMMPSQLQDRPVPMLKMMIALIFLPMPMLVQLRSTKSFRAAFTSVPNPDFIPMKLIVESFTSA